MHKKRRKKFPSIRNIYNNNCAWFGKAIKKMILWNNYFQIERELILSSDKASSKIPLMHETRTPSGVRRTVGLPLLPRQMGSIAPDHPPKQLHAWVSFFLSIFYFALLSILTPIYWINGNIFHYFNFIVIITILTKTNTKNWQTKLKRKSVA